MPPYNKREEELKRMIKEAIKEWLDEKYATFGKWTFRSLAASTLAALIYFILHMNGWTRL